MGVLYKILVEYWGLLGKDNRNFYIWDWRDGW